MKRLCSMQCAVPASRFGGSRAGTRQPDWWSPTCCEKAGAWFIDEGLAATVPDGTTLAGRLCESESFAMSGGVMVPVDADMLEKVITEPPVSRYAEPARADEPRFATAIYRAALECGVMARVAFE